MSVEPQIGAPNVATVVIVKRGHQGVFEFYDYTFSINDTVSNVVCKVRRHSGKYYTHKLHYSSIIILVLITLPAYNL